MRKLFSACMLVVLSLFLFSCEKEKSFQDIEPGSGNNGGGSNTSGNYYPLTAGSWWKYKDSVTGVITTQTATNVTKTIDNILYTGLVGGTNGVQSPDTAWAAAAIPNYYLTAEGVSPNTGASFDFAFHYLNDTASVGYNWQYIAGQGNGFVSYIKTTIMERNITKTVAGKKYNNVIHTKLDFSYDIFGSVMHFATYDYYIAEGVGIIRIESELFGAGLAFKSSGDLIDYHIE